MFLEGRALHELGAFLGALPLLSLAPRGDGHPVLVLPGPRRLRRIDAPAALLSDAARAMPSAAGARAATSACVQGVQHAMVDLVQELSDTHGRKISLVGWSLGGLYARQLAKMMPDRVRQVITLGSPFAASPKATNAWRVYEMASGRRADEEDARFGGTLAGAPPVPTTAIFSRTDGICAWQGCREQSSRHDREHRGREQPLRHGPSSRRGLCGGRPPRAEGRRVGARSTAAAGAAWSIPIRIGKRGLSSRSVRRAACRRAPHHEDLRASVAARKRRDLILRRREAPSRRIEGSADCRPRPLS